MDLDLLKRVSLLAILKKGSDETINDVMESLIYTDMFLNRSEALKVFRELRDDNYIVGDRLSMIGVVEAKRAENEFKQYYNNT